MNDDIRVVIDAEVATDQCKATVAEVQATDGYGFDYVAHGAAVRVDPDVYDETVGTKLALGRALRDLGREMIRDARKDIIHERDHGEYR